MATRSLRDHVDNESNIVWPLPRQPMLILQCAVKTRLFLLVAWLLEFFVGSPNN